MECKQLTKEVGPFLCNEQQIHESSQNAMAPSSSTAIVDRGIQVQRTRYFLLFAIEGLLFFSVLLLSDLIRRRRNRGSFLDRELSL